MALLIFPCSALEILLRRHPFRGACRRHRNNILHDSRRAIGFVKGIVFGRRGAARIVTRSSPRCDPARFSPSRSCKVRKSTCSQSGWEVQTESVLRAHEPSMRTTADVAVLVTLLSFTAKLSSCTCWFFFFAFSTVGTLSSIFRRVMVLTGIFCEAAARRLGCLRCVVPRFFVSLLRLLCFDL